MRNTYTNKLTVTLLLISFALLSSPAFAGKDDIQSRLTRQVAQLQQQFKVSATSKQNAIPNNLADCKKPVAQNSKC